MKNVQNSLAIFTAVSFLVLLIGGPAYSGSPGETAAEFLRLGSGAQIPAMGNAAVSNVSGPSALHYNPAGLANLRTNREVEATYQDLPEGINHGNLDFASPVGKVDGTWSVGLRYLDYGSQDRVIGGSPDDLEEDGTFTNTDLALSGGYGHRWNQGEGNGFLGGYFTTGGAVKLIRQELDDERASAFAFDFGAQWQSDDSPFSVGLLLANLGQGPKFDEEREDLPTLLRAGVGLEFGGFRLTGPLHPEEVDLRINFDYEYELDTGETDFMAGVEWRPFEAPLFLRMGYDGNLDVDRPGTFGLGYAFDNIRLDYALVRFGDFGNVHRFALRYRFR